MKRIMLMLALVALLSRPVASQIIVDGTLDAAYGSAIAVQTVETGFGDNLSEWNAVYAKVCNNRLHILITGNIEANFNKLNIFFDTKPGGEGQLSTLPEYDFNSGGTWISQNQGGMTFDSGFTADLHLYARTGGSTFEVDIIDRLGGGSAAVNGNTGSAAYAGGLASGTINPGTLANGTTVGNFLDEPLFFAMNNSNVAGIGGNTGTAANQKAALAVTTGFEFSIDVSDLPLDSKNLRIAIMQGNSNHNYVSNQTLAGLPVGTGNLGGDGAGGFTGTLSGVDFNNFAGDQFITVPVPLVVLGDANGDGNFDFGDIEAFFLAITDPTAYAAAFPDVDPNVALDFDCDGVASFGDIEGFFLALTGG
jgi:hypothetical protein